MIALLRHALMRKNAHRSFLGTVAANDFCTLDNSQGSIAKDSDREDYAKSNREEYA